MSSLRERVLCVEGVMAEKFKTGEHVRWNSEAGFVSGTIRTVHTKDVDNKGPVHHASADEPQYEVDSDRTEPVAMHKGAALKKSPRSGVVTVSGAKRHR